MFAGDFALESTIDLKFTTRRFTTGAPFTLAGSPVISAYPDNSTTQLTAGITLSVDFDAVTGLNNVRVVATAANGYAAGSSYFLVITTGTVDSVSVVGEVVGSFTIGRSASFGRLGAPAGASVSADIAAVKVDTAAILVDTGTTLDARIPAALVSGRMDSSVGAMAANVLTATAINADAITAAKVAADVSAEIADQVWDEAIAGHLGAGSTGAALNAAGSAGDPWSTAIPGAYGAGTAGKILGDNVNATISSRASQASVDAVQADADDLQTRVPAALVSGRIDASVGAMAANVMTAAAAAADLTTELQSGLATAAAITSLDSKIGSPAGASVSADIAAIEAQTDDIGAAGAGLTAVPWNASWDAEVESEVLDALNTILADSVPADGTLPTARQALYMITQFLFERAVSGTTVTVKKADGSTTLMTFTLNDATTPTSVTRAT
jgi:hypothetical protein